MLIKAVLFDVGETLWYAEAPPSAEVLRGLATERVRATMEEQGLDGVPAEMVAECAFAAIQRAVEGARRGSLEEPDYAAAGRLALRKLGLCASLEQAQALIEAAYVSGPEGGKVASADARRTLDELRRRGFALGIVTNRAFGGERFRADLRRAGLDIGWDAEAVSVDVGFLKPRPEIFLHALEVLGIGPSQALMVGDSLREDIGGAQRLGIPTAWVRSRPDADGVVPDYVVDSLLELLELPCLEACHG